MHYYILLCCVFRCPSWADDESIAVRCVNNELHFFENNNFGKALFCLHVATQQQCHVFKPVCETNVC